MILIKEMMTNLQIENLPPPFSVSVFINCFSAFWLGRLAFVPDGRSINGKFDFAPNECPGYDTKQSDGEVPAMWNTPSLPSLPGSLWPGVVAPDKGPIYGLNRTKPCFFHYIDFCI